MPSKMEQMLPQISSTLLPAHAEMRSSTLICRTQHPPSARGQIYYWPCPAHHTLSHDNAPDLVPPMAVTPARQSPWSPSCSKSLLAFA